MRIALCNLGCAKNQVDGESMAGWLITAGHRMVKRYEDADAILVNTCAFIQEAKQEAINTILQLAQYKRAGACRLLAVCGCLSERYRASAAPALPEVDHWFGVHTWRAEMAKVFGRPALRKPPVRRLAAPGPAQYLKIAEGCSRRCSFCSIPAIRGPYRSRPAGDLVAEARWLAGRGTVECILVSQDTSAYGRDRGTSLVRLVERLLRETSLRRLRLMYLHPGEIDDGILSLMAADERVCRYVDIPLQHVAGPVLRCMRRSPGTEDGARRLVERIRERVPGVAIRSTFIVGFPGETESHFARLLRFLEWARIEHAGVFAFSPEEGTAAYVMRPAVHGTVAQRRCREFMETQREISRSIGRARVGTEAAVLIEGRSLEHTGCSEGRTEWDAPEVDGVVHVRGARLRPGALVRVRITGADAYDLCAEALD